MKAPSSFSRFTRRGQTVLRLRPAWMSYWRAWAVSVLLLGIWGLRMWGYRGALETAPLWPSLLLGIVLIPILGGVILHRYTRSYEIESNSVLRTTIGLISRAKREYALTDKVQVDASQSIPARLLNYGNLGFWAGDDRSRMEWAAVSDPDKTVAFLRSLISGGANLDDQSHVSTTLKPNDQTHPATPTPAAEAVKAPSPPPDTIFANEVLVLPRGDAILARIVSEPKPLVENYQWVNRGDPIIKVEVATHSEGGGIFQSETIEHDEVIIRSPATGLVLSTYLQFHGADLTPSIHAFLILPVASDPKPENGASIYGGLKAAVWRHRDYLFRTSPRIKLAQKYGSSWASAYSSDTEIAEMLEEMCAADCIYEPLIPDHSDVHGWALKKHPELKHIQ